MKLFDLIRRKRAERDLLAALDPEMVKSIRVMAEAAKLSATQTIEALLIDELARDLVTWRLRDGDDRNAPSTIYGNVAEILQLTDQKLARARLYGGNRLYRELIRQHLAVYRQMDLMSTGSILKKVSPAAAEQEEAGA